MKFAYPLAAALLIPAGAFAGPGCEIMAQLAHDSYQMRQQGVSQKDASKALSRQIGETAGMMRSRLADRQGTADAVAQMATEVLQMTYSVKMRRGRTPQVFAKAYYGFCLQRYGDL